MIYFFIYNSESAFKKNTLPRNVLIANNFFLDNILIKEVLSCQ